MPTVNEIRRHYGDLQAAILTESFDLGTKAQQVDVDLPGPAKANLNPAEINNIRAAQAYAFTVEERERLKARYLEIDAELRAAVEARAAEVEDILSPEGVSFTDLSTAATAPEDALMNALEMALSTGNENAALLAFQAARERDLDAVISRAITLREDWADLYEELIEAQQEPEFPADDRFEQLAQDGPTKADILAAPQSDINISGMMR
jgi:hypothetical protein